MEGKYDFTSKTNPFGAKKKPSKEAESKLAKQREKFLLYRMDARHAAKGK